MSTFDPKKNQRPKAKPATDIAELKRLCPLPVLMKRIGYGKFAKPTCTSPFRDDKNPSWGIYEKNRLWKFKDHATGEHGDEIDFLANAYPDLKGDFPALIARYAEIAAQAEDAEEVKLIS